MPTVSITTPAYNSARFIAQTIESVISQAGNFDLHYHVQDGGSSDETCSIVLAYIDGIAARTLYCRSLTMTLSSEKDSGMYSGIKRGFSNLPVERSTLMTWINSDDLLAPGAINTALSVCASSADVEWLGGRMSQIDENSSIIVVHPPYVYPTDLIARGDCDGRGGRFIQQEGLFWSPAIWAHVGGIDDTLKAAGDWNLWRKFACVTSLHTVDTIMGFHRRHPNQISVDLAKYHAEVDGVLRSVPQSSSDSRPKYFRYNYPTKSWAEAAPVTRADQVVYAKKA